MYISNDMQAETKELPEMQETLEYLLAKFHKYEPIFDKIDLAYELAVRREVRDLRGAPYSRPFRMENLAGLARISSPEEIDNRFQTVSDLEDRSSILIQRTQQLARKALEFIERMEESLTFSEIIQKKKRILAEQLTAYRCLNSEHDRLNFLQYEALGLMAFSSGAYRDGESFEDTLEFDVRGETQFRRNSVLLTVGEIKSGKDRKKAIFRCLKRLCIMGLATRVMFGESCELQLEGEIFTPLVGDSVSEEDVRQCLDENKLLAPANGNIHIKIISIS